MKARKIFATLLTICLLISLGGITGTATDDIEVDFIVYGVECPYKTQQIINSLKGEQSITPASIFCLLGHSLAQTTAYQTTHRVFPTAPRCWEVTYRIIYCTRPSCNFNDGTVIGERPLHCCP